MVPDSTVAVVISAPQSPPQAEWFYWILTLVGSVSWSFIIVPAIKIPRAKLNLHQEVVGRTYWREGHGGAVRCWGDESLPRDRERGKPRQTEALVRTLWALRDKSPTQNIAKNKGMTLASLQEKGRMLCTAGLENWIVKCLKVPLGDCPFPPHCHFP